MIYYNLLKIVLRSWRKNKLFFLISLGSLTVGLSCTILLSAFVIHEYGIESDNPNAGRIVRLLQPDMNEGKTYYTWFPSTAPFDAFPEVESVLRTAQLYTQSVTYGQETFGGQNLALADTTLLRFFPLQTQEGELEHTLRSPDRIAVSQNLARKIFGRKNPIGEQLAFHIDGYNTCSGKEETLTLTVGAVFRPGEHSLLKADLITSMDWHTGRTSLWLKARPGTDMKAFRHRVETTEMQRLMDKGCYQTHSLSQVFFDTATQDPCQYIVAHRGRTMLYAGLLAALLVLLTGMSNYVNLSFSRLLGLAKTLHTEQLMGAGRRIVRLQLFTDTFAMLLLALVLAFLLISDLLPLFNNLYHTQLTFAYFLSAEIQPFLLLLAVCFAVLPAALIARKMHATQESAGDTFFAGHRKHRIIAQLVAFQFFLSFLLLFALMAIRGQIGLANRSADRYKGLYEISVPKGGMRLLLNETKNIKGVSGAAVTEFPSNGQLSIALSLPDDEPGEENYRMANIMTAERNYLDLMSIKVEEEIKGNHEYGIYINRTFARLLAHGGEDILGKRLGELTGQEDAVSQKTVIGIVEDMPSLYGEQQATRPALYAIVPEAKDNCLLIRCDPQHKAELEAGLKALYRKYLPETQFQLDDLYANVRHNNRELFGFAQLILFYTVISLLLIAFGLFGISWFSTRQRTREIAIRKVHGASVTRIVWLINRPFLCQMASAYLLAAPTAWWLMQHYWLEQFTHQAPAGWWYFVFPLLLVFSISVVTVTLHSYRTARSNPVNSLKIQ